jgi:hypothetical protein
VVRIYLALFRQLITELLILDLENRSFNFDRYAATMSA